MNATHPNTRHALAVFLLIGATGCTRAFDFSECAPGSCAVGLVCEVDTGLCVDAESTRIVDGVSPATVRTVGIADLSGSLSDLGEGMRDGVLAAYASHNDANPQGRRFEHVMRDDQYDPIKTTEIADEVTRDDGSPSGRLAFAIVGSMGSPTSNAMLPLLNERQVPLFGTYSGALHLRRTPPDRIVWNTRASYRLEGERVTTHLLKRDPNPVPAPNVFALSQSPLDISTQGIADLSEEATDPNAVSLDPYGMSGYLGIVDALSERLGTQTRIPLASYRATGTNTQIAQEFFFRWLGGLEGRFDGPDLTGDAPQIGVAMIAVASGATTFVQGLIDGMENLERGEKPEALSRADWELIDTDRKLDMARAALTFAMISPVGDQLAVNLNAADADAYCRDEYPIYVSQVVPFPKGQSAGAIAFREDLAAYDPDVEPGYVSFEGWIAGKTFIEAVERVEGRLTVDSFLGVLEGGEFSLDLGVGAPLAFSQANHEGSGAVYGSRLGPGCVYADYTFAR